VSKTLPTPSQAPEPDLPTTPDAPVQPDVSPEDLEVTVGGGFSGEELHLSEPDPVVDETVEEAGEEEQAGPGQEEPAAAYDPVAPPPGLDLDLSTEGQPEGPDAKKKGFFGRFRKK
ncbi:MAG: hypothetical protein JSV00_08425, partial [bacterium]